MLPNADILTSINNVYKESFEQPHRDPEVQVKSCFGKLMKLGDARLLGASRDLPLRCIRSVLSEVSWQEAETDSSTKPHQNVLESIGHSSNCPALATNGASTSRRAESAAVRHITPMLCYPQLALA